MSVHFRLFTKSSGKQKKKDSPPVERRGLFFEGQNGCAALIMHGLTGTPREVSLVGKLLNRKGYTVYCPVLANHGEPMDILKRSTWQDFYATAREAFLKLESENKYKHIFVSGISVGALLALLLADEFKERVGAVSCLSPTLFYDGWNVPRVRWLLPLGHYTFLKHFFYFKEEWPYGIKNLRLREHIQRYYSVADLDDTEGVLEYGYPYMPVSLFYQNHLLTRHLLKRLPLITVPVQLIQAREDDTTSIKNSQIIHDGVNSGLKEMVLLEDSYHLITVDQERDKVADHMDRFYREAGQFGGE